MRSVEAAPRRPSPAPAAEAARRVSAGSVVLAAALPILFLHVRYQPSLGLPLGGTFKLQDGAVLATLAAATAAAWREGLARLRPARPIWIATALLLVWVLAACFYPLASTYSYAWRTHLVTAAEFVEYALLAPAVPLLVRRRADAVLVLGTLVAWSVVATALGLAQWAGWGIVGAWPQGYRQPSFLGQHDFAALSGAALGIGLLALLWRTGGRGPVAAAWLAVVSGGIGFVLGGATAGIVGLVPAAAVAVGLAARRRLLGRRTLAASLAAVALASLGVVALRAGDFDQFSRFLGVKQATASSSANVQTYSQRTLVAYIGLRVWLHHPVVGAGWQATLEPSVIGPELPAAHARFPDLAEQAFPGPGHEYGIQLLYVQALSDLGAIGFVLLVAALAVPLAIGVRTALRAPSGPASGAALGVFWLVLALGLWTAVGFVAGLPLDALTWLAIGAVAAGSAAVSPPATAMMGD